MAAPGRTFVSIARRLIAAMSFLPCPNAYSSVRSGNIRKLKSLSSLHRFELFSALVWRRINPRSSKFKSPCRSIGVFIRASQGFFLSTHSARHQHDICQISPSKFLICGSREHTIMRIYSGRQPQRVRGFTFRSINRLAITCAFLAVLSSAATAQARVPFRVGGLTCNTDPRVGLVLGSRQDMRCVFVARGPGQRYAYTGTIRRIGVDIGVTRGGTLFWAVFARNSQIGRGTLRGSYVGVSGNVAVGLGLGAKVLIGGSRRTITLQPLSVEGQIGVNLALGIANFTCDDECQPWMISSVVGCTPADEIE